MQNIILDSFIDHKGGKICDGLSSFLKLSKILNSLTAGYIDKLYIFFILAYIKLRTATLKIY